MKTSSCAPPSGGVASCGPLSGGVASFAPPSGGVALTRATFTADQTTLTSNIDAGVQDEVRRALAGPISTTARKAMGIDEVARLPQAEAVEALVVRTRRYASYQRKWMRRVAGLVMVGADRPPGEVADEIVSLARARERLPRR